MPDIPKLNDLTQLFILGDSYSDIGWTYPNCLVPTEKQPLGCKPGQNVRWCVGKFQDNWVVHLSKSRDQQMHDLLIYDVAKGGDETYDLLDQFDQLNEMVQSGNERVEENSLFVLWIGINDVGMATPSSTFDIQMSEIDRVLNRMYDLDLRNLVLVDVPPRKPSAMPEMKLIEEKITRWNSLLPARLNKWLEKPNTSGKIFSSHKVFSDILNNPTKYGFEQEDPEIYSGRIWVDGLHPTSAVFMILSREFEKFLQQ